MNDNDIYEAYSGYEVAGIVWHSLINGCVGVKFKPNASKTVQLPEHIIVNFKITDCNVIVFDHWLPEFLSKELENLIRERSEERNQYLWGV